MKPLHLKIGKPAPRTSLVITKKHHRDAGFKKEGMSLIVSQF